MCIPVSASKRSPYLAYRSRCNALSYMQNDRAEGEVGEGGKRAVRKSVQSSLYRFGRRRWDTIPLERGSQTWAIWDLVSRRYGHRLRSPSRKRRGSFCLDVSSI